MTRKEFFEWLETCPSHKWNILSDSYGLISVNFTINEEEEDDETG